MRIRLFSLFCLSWLVVVPLSRVRAADTFVWSTNKNIVSADIKSSDLISVLERIAGATHWKVFLEPGTRHSVSTKFKDLPPNEALRLLLGDVNFAVLPGVTTNSDARLYVFRTRMAKATQAVIAARDPNHGRI